MAFGGVFSPVFRPAFDLAGAAATPPASNWWEAGGAPTPLVVYQPKGAASLAASYVNLVNPGTYDAAPGAAPGWSSGTGWVFSGAEYLLTTLVPTFSGGQSVWAMLVRFSGANTDGGTLSGEFTPGARFDLVARQPYQDKHSYGNGDVVLVEPRLDSGVMAIAGTQGYLNGVADGAAIAAGYTTTATQIGIGARGDGTDFYVGDILAVAIWDTSTGHATWMPAVSAAVALI